MTEVVAWVGEWKLIRNQRGKEPVKTPVRSIVVASKHGILTADFKLRDDGGLDMQSRFEPGTWNGKDPTKTFSQNLWEHGWIKNLQTKCRNRSGGRSFTQRDPAPSGATFDDLGLHEQVMNGCDGAKELWRNWCELEGMHHVPRYYDWPDDVVPHQIYSPTHPDMNDPDFGFAPPGFKPVDHYANDSVFGIF